MRVLADILERLRALLFRNRIEREMAEELRFHVQRETEERIRNGASPSAARREAILAFGGVEPWKEEVRDARGVRLLEDLGSDFRYALRGLRRSPGFTVTVILTLGLGIGANAAMFNVVDQLMFRPPAYLRDPGMVDRVYFQVTVREGPLLYQTSPYTRYLDLRRWTTAFSEVAAFTHAVHGVGAGDAARERAVLGVSANYFDFFSAQPVLGRFFSGREDSLPRGADVAVLSYAYWQAEFGGRNVVGDRILVGNVHYTILGVAPTGFSGLGEGAPPALFIPITAYGFNQGGGSRGDYFQRYNWDWVEVMVRRRPGVDRATATSDLSQAFVRSRAAARALVPASGQEERLSPRALAGPLKSAAGPDPGLEARTLLWVAGVSGIVLVIACANVANLFLVRALRRRRELSVRLALGVSRRRLLAQSLTEALLLSLLGALVGLGIAQWGGAGLRRLVLPHATGLDLAADGRTLAVALAATLVAALATGLAPPLLARGADLAGALKAGGRTSTGDPARLRSTLLVLQGALSVVLLVGAGLFVQSLGKIGRMHLGYDANPVLMVDWERRGTPLDADQRVLLRRQLLEAARGLPGVVAVGGTSQAPFQPGTSTAVFRVPGIDSVGHLGRFAFQPVSGDYFEAVETRILRGRPLTDQDHGGAPLVVVVSQAMEEALWPGQSPLGQCLHIDPRGARPDTMPCTTVVGVAENAVHDPVEDLPLRYYLPDDQVQFGTSLLLLRMHPGALAQTEDVRRALQGVMPGQAYVTVQSASRFVAEQQRSWRLGATMFLGLGALALLVSAVGLYGVIGYTVAQRMHELGIRVALGAQSGNIMRLVVGQGVRLAVVGVVIGLAIALAASRWVQPLLFQQSATDLPTYALVGLAMIAVAVVASLAPALRAARADPNAALRADGT